MDAIRTGPRVRAPEFGGGEWINVAAPLTLRGLRGRFVLLDFWTSCCGNCLHVLDELRPFEAAHADVLTVIGVHSPKFPHEAGRDAVAAAVARYGVAHPVRNDPDLALWRQYAVHAWPTLVLIDPAGYVVAQAAGEGQVSALSAIVDRLRAEAPGTATAAPVLTDQQRPDQPLYFPASAIVLPAERTGRAADSLLVANAGAHDLVELDPAALHSGDTEAAVLRRVGSGRRGELFAEPNGLALLPAGVAPYDVLVADTANHVLRGLRLPDSADSDIAVDDIAVTATIDLPAALAGAHTVTGPVPPVLSPWDVAWWPAIDRVVVAAAGVHLLLEFDPRTGEVSVLAGTTVEGLRDGPAADAWLAQPSGLAVDGDRLWFVDAETSALRFLDAGRSTLAVGTAVGEGLFDFGHVDGPAAAARLQHPLGVTLLPDGPNGLNDSVAVLDTYNGAVRRYNPSADEVTTLATGLAEPSGAVLVDGELVVVESAAHRLVRPVRADQRIVGDALVVQRPPADLASGPVLLDVSFEPAPGRVLDDRYGPATRLSISASPPQLLRAGAGEGTDLHRALEFDATTAGGVLHVSAQAASCDADAEVAHPACHLARQDWGIPIRLVAYGDRELRLPLLG